jgi:hypothetical protein
VSTVKISKPNLTRLISEGLTGSEIAERVGCTENAVENLVYAYWGVGLITARKMIWADLLKQLDQLSQQ